MGTPTTTKTTTSKTTPTTWGTTPKKTTPTTTHSTSKKTSPTTTGTKNTTQTTTHSTVTTQTTSPSNNTGSTTSDPPAPNDLIPIIVGAVLGGLVIIVLLGYFIARCRKSSQDSAYSELSE